MDCIDCEVTEAYVCTYLITTYMYVCACPSEYTYFFYLQAMKYIFEMKGKLADLKDKETLIRRGLNIFKIEQPPSHAILTVEKVHCI